MNDCIMLLHAQYLAASIITTSSSCFCLCVRSRDDSARNAPLRLIIAAHAQAHLSVFRHFHRRQAPRVSELALGSFCDLRPSADSLERLLFFFVDPPAKRVRISVKLIYTYIYICGAMRAKSS